MIPTITETRRAYGIAEHPYYGSIIEIAGNIGHECAVDFTDRIPYFFCCFYSKDTIEKLSASGSKSIRSGHDIYRNYYAYYQVVKNSENAVYTCIYIGDDISELGQEFCLEPAQRPVFDFVYGLKGICFNSRIIIKYI